ncbi:MAG: enoyl-CoA hydratase-related protein [Proteobacteria bacterium]|nr:enoyl-CoA hydratase-related protein [Pseudomonadota bacterium]
MRTIKLENQGQIWILTLQRPEALNALSSEVLSDLAEALDQLEEKPFSECRCLVLTGSGEKAFVAGADIKEISQMNQEESVEFAHKGQKIFSRFEELPFPVIAAVNGFALGGGLELALACDFMIASEKAKLGLPETTLGLIPGFGGTVRLSRSVGLNAAKRIIFTGEMITAVEAQAMGLVSQVVKPEELMATAIKVAETLCARGPVALHQAKKSIFGTFDLEKEEAMEFEAQRFSELFSTSDIREGTAAFLEKRKPAFKGS